MPERVRIPESKPDHAGLVQWRRSRQTGTIVGIYDGIAADMDTDAGRWQTVCEEHASIVSHRTLTLARAWAPFPADWCEKCAGGYE